jgi:hypothetical protein
LPQVLNAWGNQLTALPDSFGSLGGLVRLGLKGNQLAALPPSFTALTNLVEIFLTDNKLTTLPAGVWTHKVAFSQCNSAGHFEDVSWEWGNVTCSWLSCDTCLLQPSVHKQSVAGDGV